MSDDCLAVENLTVAYGDRTAVNGVSFAVAKGEIVGLLGPNGAGKTTLVKAVTGRAKPNAGAITVLGRPVAPGGAWRHSIGFTPQHIGLYPHMTAAENLNVFARLAGFSKGARAGAVASALDAVDLADRAVTLVSAMSGGMQRRINFAAGVLTDPDLIVLDEPTAGVDVGARNLIHRLARDRAAGGAGVLLITHELTEAERLCDRVVILKDGVRAAFGAPDALIAEAFGAAEEYHVRLKDAPPPDKTQALQSLGFTADETGNSWRACLEAEESTMVAKIRAALGADADLIRETAIRRPDLSSLMRRLTQGEGV